MKSCIFYRDFETAGLIFYFTEIVAVPFFEATILPFFTVAIFLLLVLYLMPPVTFLSLYFTVIGVLLFWLSPTYRVIFGTVTTTLPDFAVAACTGTIPTNKVRISDSTKINDRFFLLVFMIFAPFDVPLIILLKYTCVNFKRRANGKFVNGQPCISSTNSSDLR